MVVVLYLSQFTLPPLPSEDPQPGPSLVRILGPFPESLNRTLPDVRRLRTQNMTSLNYVKPKSLYYDAESPLPDPFSLISTCTKVLGLEVGGTTPEHTRGQGRV